MHLNVLILRNNNFIIKNIQKEERECLKETNSSVYSKEFNS